jgi:hypothetical protein
MSFHHHLCEAVFHLKKLREYLGTNKHLERVIAILEAELRVFQE